MRLDDLILTFAQIADLYFVVQKNGQFEEPQPFLSIRSMIAHLFLIVTAVFITVTEAYHRPNHFGNPCVLCKCFVEYTDRDKPIALKPYGAAIDGYDTTEDQCLATCLKDIRCKAVVYGFIGGRDVFTCELYETATLSQLVYVPFVNTYLPRKKSSCKVSYNHLKTLELSNRQEEVVKRKKKYRSLSAQQNPFNFG